MIARGDDPIKISANDHGNDRRRSSASSMDGGGHPRAGDYRVVERETTNGSGSSRGKRNDCKGSEGHKVEWQLVPTLTERVVNPIGEDNEAVRGGLRNGRKSG